MQNDFRYNLSSETFQLEEENKVQIQSALENSFGSAFLVSDLVITILVILAGIVIGMCILTHLRSIQKKEADAFLSSILNTTLSGIISFKAIREKGIITDFRVTFVNKPILNFLGRSEKDTLNKTAREINPLIEQHGVFDKYKEVTESGKPIKFERMIGNKYFYVLLTKFNDGFIASFNNITDLKGTEQKLNQKVQELENINLELEQFAYVASHDLQEPLRKINMFADMVLKSPIDKEQYFHLSSIVRSAARMRKLIMKLSEYSKLKNNNSLIRTVDLNDILRDLLMIYGDLMRQCNTTLSVGKLPFVQGIPLQLYTLFDNLINNAIKFSRPEQPSMITIRTIDPDPNWIAANENLNPDIDYVEIIFKDNGLGFAPEYSSKIFQIFQTLDKKAGTDDVGIGLALCLKIARGHHGDIYAVSTVGEGSEFHILLPTHYLVESGGNGAVTV
jgi:signal transduction histidine kinase